jgi:hypothetical protein
MLALAMGLLLSLPNVEATHWHHDHDCRVWGGLNTKEQKLKTSVLLFYFNLPLCHMNYNAILVILPLLFKTNFHFSCSISVGVRYSATLKVSTATPIVATPSASSPVTVCLATRSFTVT